MKDELFSELVESVGEGGAILKGEAAPARAFEIELPKDNPPTRLMRPIQETAGTAGRRPI